MGSCHCTRSRGGERGTLVAEVPVAQRAEASGLENRRARRWLHRPGPQGAHNPSSLTPCETLLDPLPRMSPEKGEACRTGGANPSPHRSAPRCLPRDSCLRRPW